MIHKGRIKLYTDAPEITYENVIDVVRKCIPNHETNASDSDELIRYDKGEQPRIRLKQKRKDIDKALRKAGWVIIHGGNHDLAQHPQKPGIKIPIPRHTEVNEQTARGILKQAGIQ